MDKPLFHVTDSSVKPRRVTEQKRDISGGIDDIQYKFKVGLALSFLLNILILMAFVAYGGLYASEKFANLETRVDELSIQNTEMRREISRVKSKAAERTVTEPESTTPAQRAKREVISNTDGSIVNLKSLIRGPPGPPGPAGKDGSDGRDFASLDLLHDVVNKTVQKEWAKLTSHLPAYSGENYIRWGRKTCPSSSKLIYSGQMSGSDYRSSGGATNYQCLPNDPEYNKNAPTGVPHSKLRAVWYEIYQHSTIFGNNLHAHLIPCVVCEAEQRVNSLMIPAKTRCPTAGWTLEYSGYLMSPAEQHADGSMINNHFRGSFVCIDVGAESVTSKPVTSYTGERLYLVTASCTKDGVLSNCPPYRSDDSALSCVVCTK